MQRSSEVSVEEHDWNVGYGPSSFKRIERTRVRVHEHKHRDIRLPAGMDDIGHNINILLKLPYVA